MCHIPFRHVTVERRGRVEHPFHISHPGHGPVRDATVERYQEGEHAAHAGHLGHVPVKKITVKFVRSGGRSADLIEKQHTHIGHSRDIPGPNRPVRTLGAVGGQFQALSNGGLELHLILRSPPCSGVLL